MEKEVIRLNPKNFDVIKSLENESLYTNIDISVIDDLKSDWLDKINKYTDLTKIDELREGVSLNVDENGYIEQKDEEMIDSGCLESSETADEDSGENYQGEKLWSIS